MKKELRKKGGKKGSPPIVEIIRTPHHYEEVEKETTEVITPIIEPIEDEK